WARPRTLPGGEQRAPAAQTLFRRTLLGRQNRRARRRVAGELLGDDPAVAVLEGVRRGQPHLHRRLAAASEGSARQEVLAVREVHLVVPLLQLRQPFHLEAEGPVAVRVALADLDLGRGGEP